MAKALEDIWPGPLQGLVVTRYGSAVPCRQIEIVEARHPVPDEAGRLAAQRILSMARDLTEADLVVALISGGGSALLPAPAPGLTFDDEQQINRSLLRSGAPIGSMNLIRNQFSTIKGGRLALACHPATVWTLLVSDVPGDDPALVASGPTVAMSGSRKQARRLANLYGIDLPEAARELLATERNAAPRPTDRRFARNVVRTVASASLSLDAAAAVAQERGIACHVLSDAIEGEAKVVAGVHAGIVREMLLRGRPFRSPAVLLSGGETTVTIKGVSGRGGRNTEFLLGLALAIEGLDSVVALAADTDGIDGSETNAGAFVDGTSASRMRDLGIDPLQLLAANDAYAAFEALGDLFFTGPTGTNVNDFRAIFVN